IQNARGSQTAIRTRINLADIDFEPAHPAGCEVVHRRSDDSGDAPNDAVQNREKNNGAEANPNARAPGTPPPAKLPKDPAIMENSATQIPMIKPRNAYTTSPTLNADPGAIRLTVAMLASFAKLSGC